MRVMLLMPAHNTVQTLAATVAEVPARYRSDILVVDDGSRDGTAELARSLGLEVISHPRNLGYGATQKTGYTEALARGLDAVVMIHSDNQYSAAAIPALLEPLRTDRADAVLGSRRLEDDPRALGMPGWRYLGNRFLTSCENRVLGLRLTDYHSGLRAYNTNLLRAVSFDKNSDDFVFDQQILVQARAAGLRIMEVPARCRYAHDTSSISFSGSVSYGLGTLRTLALYRRHKRSPDPNGLLNPRQTFSGPERPLNRPEATD